MLRKERKGTSRASGLGGFQGFSVGFWENTVLNNWPVHDSKRTSLSVRQAGGCETMRWLLTLQRNPKIQIQAHRPDLSTNRTENISRTCCHLAANNSTSRNSEHSAVGILDLPATWLPRKCRREMSAEEPYLETARPLNVQVTPGASLLAFRKSGPKCTPKENVLGFCFEEAVCTPEKRGLHA